MASSSNMKALGAGFAAWTMAFGLTACGGQGPTSPSGSSRPLALPKPVSSVAPDLEHLSVQISLLKTQVSVGTAIAGLLSITNRGTPFDLTGLERSGCRPQFQIYLSNGTLNNEHGFTGGCANAPFILVTGTTRLPFVVETNLPEGTYEAVIAWSEPVPLPVPHQVTVAVRGEST
jgi:hypothetical protein